MTKTQTAPAITYTPFFGTRDEHLEERAHFSLNNAVLAYYADQTDATTDETVAATDLALTDHVSSSRETVTITAAALDEYLRTVRNA